MIYPSGQRKDRKWRRQDCTSEDLQSLQRQLGADQLPIGQEARRQARVFPNIIPINVNLRWRIESPAPKCVSGALGGSSRD